LNCLCSAITWSFRGSFKIWDFFIFFPLSKEVSCCDLCEIELCLFCSFLGSVLLLIGIRGLCWNLVNYGDFFLFLIEFVVVKFTFYKGLMWNLRINWF
jgi:hypothetical protein